MRKLLIAGFLTMFIFSLNVSTAQAITARELSEQIKEINSDLTVTRIKLSQSIIEELNNSTDLGIILSMKSIHNFAEKYSDFLDYESTMIYMYPFLSDSVKLYFSASLRDKLKQKRKEVDWYMENFPRHQANITKGSVLQTLSQLRKQTEAGQIIVDEMIKYYASENEKYKDDNR